MLSHIPNLETEYQVLDLNGNIKRIFGSKKKIQSDDLITINIMTKNGIIKKQIKQPFKSYLANFGRMLQHSWFTTANGGSTGDNMLIEAATGGTTILATSAFSADLTEAALSSPTQTLYGIWIGDLNNKSALGLTVESGVGGVLHYNNYMLRTLMLPDGGSPDTNLVYREVNVTMPDADTLRISRRFQNNSGSTIYVDEVGMIGKSSTPEYFMIARDLIVDSSGATEVPYATILDTEVLEIVYEFTVTDASELTSNWLKYLSSIFVEGNAVAQPKATDGSLNTVDFSSARTQQDLNAADNIDTHGIVIGGHISGAEVIRIMDPVTTDSFKLTNILLDSDIDYSIMTVLAINLQADYHQIGFYRDFENDRSDSKALIVQESAIYMKEAAGSLYYMLARSLVDATSGEISIAKDEILRVKNYFKFNI